MMTGKAEDSDRRARVRHTAASADFDDSQRVVMHPNGRLSVTLWEERNFPEHTEMAGLLEQTYFDAKANVPGHPRPVPTSRLVVQVPDGMTAEKLRRIADDYEHNLSALGVATDSEATKRGEPPDSHAHTLRAWADVLAARDAAWGLPSRNEGAK